VIDAAFGYWLAGFIDGEGSFQIARYRNKSGDSYGCRLKLAVRYDDHPLLGEIQRTLGLGKLYTFDSTRSGMPRRYSHWEAFRREDCSRMVEILDTFPLRSKKRQDYLIWRDAVRLHASVRLAGRWASPERLATNRAIYEQMAQLQAQIQSGRAYRHV
jgi:hypothetical protein